ncbi:hypothetical protein CHS0354_040820 [Potamilus streckersoni]|uniref:Uncharacterized protein n=1 Tax=Potamilus streckersoni TaxID=2493646 RepID=A0AAE0VXC0_9BIVA|nr:hypothetical protein CHS0354_040820 [Potamilus streckersoni]
MRELHKDEPVKHMAKPSYVCLWNVRTSYLTMHKIDCRHNHYIDIILEMDLHELYADEIMNMLIVLS